MLGNLIIIFSACVVATKATGEFTILNVPKSLSFKGNEPIHSYDIGEVVYVSLGNDARAGSQWSGLNIVDPFNLPKSVIAVSLYGVEQSKVSALGKTYPVQGNNIEQSLNGVTDQLKADNEQFCAISYEELEQGKSKFKNPIGDGKIPSVINTKYLNGNIHTADKEYLEYISYVNAVADNLVNMKKACNFIYISLSVDAIAMAHGENSAAFNESIDLFYTALKNLNAAAQKSGNEVLVVATVNKADGKSRSKRDADPQDDKTLYNLAEYYNQDYPVIFNIILWFMVIFAFSLLAICYAIGSMDPGRDSIIYRMTSTRMKKDN